MKWIIWITTFVTLQFAVGFAQTPQLGLPATFNGPVVTVPFFAEDDHGNPLAAITQADLAILDNRKPPLSIKTILTAKEQPLRLGILIDSSNSEGLSSLYRPALHEASGLVEAVLQGSDDKSFVVSFGVVPDGTSFMTRDEFLKFRLDATPRGATALHDAILFACRDRMEADRTQTSRRVLVVISDGGDNVSHATRDEALAAAQKAGTVIFAVSTNERSGDDRGDRTLEHFAETTGGRAFLHLRSKDVPKVFANIREQIENMYAVTYVPEDLGHPGKYRSIELKITSGKKFKLRSPKGYYVTAETH